MGPAAVLRVLVKVDGMAKTAAQVKALDSDLQKAGRSADATGGSFSGTGRDVRKLSADVSQARSHVKGFGDDTDQTNRNVRRFGAAIGGASGGVGMLSGAVGALGGGFGRFAGSIVVVAPALLALSGAAVAVGAALGPLVGLAGAAAVGLVAAAQAAGVFALAAAGVSAALKEQSAVQAKVSKAAVSGASQERAAARAIQSAQEGVRTAKQQVGSASAALADAQRGEKYATENLSIAHRAQTDALKALGTSRRQARRDLEDMSSALVRSAQDEQRAILTLADARDALNRAISGPDASTIADAQDAAADSARGETQATLTLAKARETLAAINADPTASAIDKAQAALDLADAENAVGDAMRNTAKTSQQLAELEKGADPKAIATARLDVAVAEQAVTDAQRDRLRQQKDTAAAEKAGISGSAQVIAAVQGIAAADRDVIQAQRALQGSHRQVTAAQRGLIEAGRGVTQALGAVRDAHTDAQAGAAGAAAASVNLNEKFDALPPAAQAFVRVLLALKPKLDEIRAVAAAGLFPGVTAGLHAAMGSFESVKKVTAETATVMGGLAKRAGELVGSKGFGKDLETIGGRNAGIIDRVGRATIHAGDAFRHLLVAAGPLTTWLAKVTLEWARGAAESAKAARETGRLGDFFQKTRNVLTRVASIVGNLATAFLEMGKAAAPSGRDILQSLDAISARFAGWAKSIGGQRALQDFFEQSAKLSRELMPALGGVLASLGSLAFHVMPAYIAILEALGPLAGPLIQAFLLYKIALTAAAVATNLVAAAQWLLNAALAANPIVLVVIGLAALAAALVVAYRESETFRGIVQAVWTFVKSYAQWLMSVWVPVFRAVAAAVSASWQAIKAVTIAVWGWFKPYLLALWEVLKAAVTTYFGIYRTVIGAAWTAIRTATSTAWNAITGLLKGAWGAIETAAGVAWAAVRIAILEPIRQARDVLGTIWTAIRERAATAWSNLREGAGAFAGHFKDAIVGAFKGAVNKVVDFVNMIIDVVNKIPGVDIGKVKGFAEGGQFKAAQGFARGGAFARTGGLVNRPITLMGEEAPRHPEFVIPTNPAYRDRARGLLARAAGVIGLAQGGVAGDFRRAIDATDAGPKSSLALFMAGIVESRMANLPYGDLDSRGALQIRDSTARSMGVNNMDPYASALAFLTRGFWGKGSAMQLAARNPGSSAGWVAQQTQGSAFPDRYDQVRTQAMAYLQGKGGGLIGAISDALSYLDPSELIGKLPNPADALPGWLKGLGEHVISKVKDYITSKLSFQTGEFGLGEGAGTATGTLKILHDLAKRFGLRISSTYRTPEHNAAVGGVANSLHTHGSPANPGAGDLVGGLRAMQMAMQWARSNLSLKELLMHDVGSGLHLHLGFFEQGGMFGGQPFVGSYKTGGTVPQTGMALVHRGETITPAGGPPVFNVDVYVGGEKLDDRIDVRIVQRDRGTDRAYRAGTLTT